MPKASFLICNQNNYMRKIIDSVFPSLARFYRHWRDTRIATSRKILPTSLGFNFIGVESMPETRVASGEVALLRGYLAKSDAFIDVGSNCGFYSMLACQAGVPVLCFEPNAENYQFLLRNISHNRFVAEAYQMALSDRPGVLELFGGGEGASLVPNWGGMRSTYSQLVAANTLDNLTAGRFLGARIFVKIDAEGHEFPILAGAGNLMSRTPSPIWLIEHGLTENYDGGINPNFLALFEKFWAMGYSSHVAEEGQVAVTRSDVERWVASGKRDFGGVNFIFRKD